MDMATLNRHKQNNELYRKKKWLKRYRKNEALLDRLKDKLFSLDERIHKIQSPNYSGMPKGGGAVVTIDDLLDEKVELVQRINARAKLSKKLKSETITKIDELDDPRHAEVLEAYYVEKKDFRTIARENHYGVRHVMRLYREALDCMTLQ